MWRRAPRLACLALLTSVAVLPGRVAGEVPAFEAPVFRSQPVAYGSLEGWAEDDHAAAFATFRRSCAAPARAPGPAVEVMAALARICGDVAALGSPDAAAARLFFEQHFQPLEIIRDGGGFLTGYYEPDVAGSPVATAAFPTPLLGPPSGSGPIPDRDAIEAGALGERARPLVYLDTIEAFVIHVQGSARIRLLDGSVVRVGFAGRNGQPYTSIGRVLAEREHVPPAEMGLAGWTGWLRAHPDEARSVMDLNRSYIFFRRLDEVAQDDAIPEDAARADAADGPVGAAGIALTAGRSLAIDARIWSYGMPVWLEVDRPATGDWHDGLHRLVVAQDTGAAIVGAARGDLFVGSGAAAGAQAGTLREAARFVVLMPRGVSAGSRPSAGPSAGP